MSNQITNEQDIKHNFIAGEWRSSSEYMQNINPSDTNDVIATYATATSNDVQDAV
jgi:acyl-CoA reductase-like NAD-dependent aldehyde dehydrogenase